MSLQYFFIILRARYKVALYMLLVTVALTLIVSLLMPNKYVATTSLVIDVKQRDPLLGMVLAGMQLPSYMATQTDIIKSDRVAQGAVKLLKLDQDPKVRDQWTDATQGKGSMVEWLGGLLKPKLKVKPSRDQSNVVEISFTAGDPNFAAMVANAFAHSYIDTNLELKVDPARQYAAWFRTKVKSLRSDLESAQARLASYQEKTGIVTDKGNSGNFDSAKIAELSGQLVLTESQQAELQSKNGHARHGDTLTDVMHYPVIMNLKDQINTQEAKLKKASLNLGKNNPQYLAMENEIAMLKQKLADETEKVLNSISTANSVSKKKENMLRATIEEHKKKAIQKAAEQNRIAVLENDVESARKAYDTVVQQYTQSNLQSQSNQTNISVLTPATPPNHRSSPNILKNLLLAVFGGTLLGVGAAFVAEMFDQRVRSSGALGSATGVPMLAYFTRNPEPAGARKWLMDLVAALRAKFRPGQAATVT